MCDVGELRKSKVRKPVVPSLAPTADGGARRTIQKCVDEVLRRLRRRLACTGAAGQCFATFAALSMKSGLSPSGRRLQRQALSAPGSFRLRQRMACAVAVG